MKMMKICKMIKRKINRKSLQMKMDFKLFNHKKIKNLKKIKILNKIFKKWRKKRRLNKIKMVIRIP